MTKIALITGGSRGLGKDMALRLAQTGCNVIITYQSQLEQAHDVVSQICETGQKAVALKLDVGEIKSFDDFVSKLQALLLQELETEKIDFLINNAGIGATIPIAQVTEEDFDRLVNIHFKGVFFLTQKLLPHVNDGGRIINISSGTTRFANPGYSVYASAKSAIETFTRYLAKEVGVRGITANVVAPGAIETDFNNATVRSNPQIKNLIASNTALGRVGQAEDIGGIIAFLCSPDAKWINGQRIEASGGVFL
ncbi:MAG: 3-oxoacyl-[acyl-carrier-protein] reductase FabG [Chroococcopsis gigantea SAG 12.99]|jgi:NAD(P)-dependent dehydrogenase (short-subunit alcohol dehydrogenase family)|nr:SDR family oxidoreductase [Chlorogloea purpurea SAG 13.99]MDV3001046.1 3-oxoacyl-[acyl-carrier-protein] reductase FabG [Chroococcopsis gigantea SAG 12.99]